MSFGERFQTKRKKKKLTVEQMARSCGISRSYIVLIEGGKRHPGVKNFHKIASALGIPVHTLLNWYLEDMRERLNTELGTK